MLTNIARGNVMANNIYDKPIRKKPQAPYPSSTLSTSNSEAL
jgi:hypothetical protein